ncbi:tRNA1(Val) (adenine(37)-N6)-methyltransferase [Gilliamella sp. wkB112]|uniref:tRNA1(Val) (adenine(37)-N6)-methyltransferase n=1 Tax=Gilliamella sp. wkB112 TaxID=3120257 RepID=UPI00080E0B88|nr:methyltransferase [Gilliamella apicola]OCG00835.1 hypothetical protein A9G12_03465 [Gilliamella apicola]
MPSKSIELKKGGFTFKRFFVAHDNSPMRVTTDSCLLGAWAPLNSNSKRILDIGCGCGVIALMLAQRLENQDHSVDAIDIDAQAVNQCQQNIAQIPFVGVHAYQADIKQFRINQAMHYDFIVTNPPYFDIAVDCRSSQRQLARYTASLDHQQLLDAVKRLLAPTGVFCLVLPYHLASQFQLLCQSNQLYLQQIMQVKYNANKDFSLTLMAFSRQQSNNPLEQQLCMRDDDGRYSSAFRQLLADFYLFRK